MTAEEETGMGTQWVGNGERKPPKPGARAVHRGVPRTMRIEFRLNAGPHERFSDAFAQYLIGQTPRLTTRLTDDDPVIADYGTATVVDAKVIEDGAAVLITYELIS